MLEALVREAEGASSRRSLVAVRKKLQATSLLESNDVETRRAAGDLLRKINAKLSGVDTEGGRQSSAEPRTSGEGFPIGPIVAAALLLLSLAGVVFFLSRPSHKEAGVPVVFDVKPENTTVEVDGQTCVMPDCKVFLKPGDYSVKLSKTGYLPKDVFVSVKQEDQTAVNVSAALASLSTPTPGFDYSALAKISIQGALPGTRISMDGKLLGAANKDGLFMVYIAPGSHTIDLSLDGFSNRSFTRNFGRGESVSLTKEDVQLGRGESNARP